MTLRLDRAQYHACGARFRRVVGAQPQLLVEEVGSGKQRWIDVELLSDLPAPSDANQGEGRDNQWTEATSKRPHPRTGREVCGP